MTARAVRSALAGLLALALLGASPTAAGAQAKPQPQAKPPAKPQPTAKPKPKPTGPQWEVEVHASFAIPLDSVSGLDNQVGPGESFTLGDGTTSSRAVHSWLVGPGSAFLNQVLTLRGLPQRVTSIDSNGWPEASHLPGAQVGARIARRLTDAVWIEFSADLGLAPLGFEADVKDRIESARSSFVSAITALNNSTPTLMPGPSVSATATVVEGGRRLITTGVVHFRSTRAGLKPYLLGGAGFMMPLGRDTTLEFAGQYRLTTPGGTVFEEFDTVTLRYHSSPSFVAVAGFGYMGDISPRSGWRAEVRVMFGGTGFDATLNTRPELNLTSPAGAAILNGTNPGLQFANNGLRTNLSAPALRDFAALSASGRTTMWVMSGGYYWRF